MDSNKFLGIFIPKAGFYVWIAFTAILIAIITNLNKNIGLFSTVLIVGIFIYYSLSSYKRRKEFSRYIENLSFNINSATKSTLLKSPLPLVVTELSGTVIWHNILFGEIFDSNDKLNTTINSFVSEICEKKPINYSVNIDKQISIDDRYFNILGNFIEVQDSSKEYILLLYFIDVTDSIELERRYLSEKNSVGILVIDNYEDLMQGMEDTKRPQLLAKIDECIVKWMEPSKGILRKFERDKYLFVCEYQYLKKFEEEKFSILESLKEIDLGNKIPVTLSAGIGLNSESFISNFQNATASLDIALGRGGDQVAIKNGEVMTFIGGNSREHEKRTKVKSRVISHALKELIEQSNQIMIMGHTNCDIDALGAAIGLYRIITCKGKKAHIVLNQSNPSIDAFVEKIYNNKEYDDLFLKKNEAIDLIDSKTLLIVVDTHRPSYVECPELLNHSKQIVIIDHHRRATDFIDDPVLVYHETYASSTCELVTEIMQYIVESIKLPRLEAEALYAGIVVDTKNFTFKTGVRTFEAAAFLRKHGVDTVEVKQLLQNDFKTYVAISEVVRNVELLEGKIAISTCPPNIQNVQLIAAQAADQLLGLTEINAAFVLSQIEDNIAISGRSTGDINVQVILEKIGGGGHLTIAGAQIQDSSMSEAIEILKSAILEYFNQGSKEP